MKVTKRGMRSSDGSAEAYLHNRDDEAIVLDFVEDAILTLPYSVYLRTSPLLASYGTRVRGQPCDPGDGLLLLLLV